MDQNSVLDFTAPARPTTPSDEAAPLTRPQPAQDQQAPRRKRAQRLRRSPRLLGFLACVALPTLIAAGYEYGIAADQYVSSFKFIVRQQTPQTTEPGSVLSALGGGNPMLALIQDSEVTVQYIESGQILEDLRPKLALAPIFHTPKADWFSRMGANLPPERQLLYWRRMVHPYFDLSSGVVTVKVRAFTPDDAARLARAVLDSTQALVNDMSRTARQNALAYAEQTAHAAQLKLAADEASLADYRNRNSVLFPELSAQSNNSVGTTLTTRLNEDEATLATLRAEGQSESSPQVKTLQARINATRTQIQKLEAALASANGGKTQSLASLISHYNALKETAALDEKLYAADLQALQNARNLAAEKSVYLESFVQPAMPVASLYPERWLVTAETALAGFIAWILLTLVVNILRDQLD